MAGLGILVGAGPGDPGLLTLRGREALEGAEVVVYDTPCEDALLALIPRAAERIPVGSWPGAGRLCQAEINALLVERVGAGLRVVRLENGDPFLFGRGAEEAQALSDAGFAFAVVPGVPAFAAAAEYAGIPATLRSLGSQMVVAFAQSGPEARDWGLDLDGLARAPGTLAIYLEPKSIAPVASELVRRGRDPQTPAAVVCAASLCAQRVVDAPLGDIGASGASGAEAPCILFAGEAVKARAPLAWAERRPLAGRAVVLTRAAGQNGPMAARLEEMGAQVIELPCIAIAPPESYADLDRAIGGLARFDWVAFTSPNGVEHFLARLEALGKDARALAGARLAAVGAATAQALAAAHLKTDIVPSEFNAEALAAALVEQGVAQKRFLVVRALEGREVLPDALRSRGAEVELAIAYRTVRPEADVSAVRARAAEGRLGAVAFASPSAVRHFVSFFQEGEAARLLRATCVAAIGPVTAKAVEEQGVEVRVRPKEATAEALALALAEALGKSPRA